jgi:hypothetical protein
MPSKVRIISKRDDSWNRFIADLVEEDGFGAERTYFGITTPERAEEVRRKIRTAGRHLEVSVKAFWQQCQGCKEGGPECRYHVQFAAYDPAEAKAFMARKAKAAESRIR